MDWQYQNGLIGLVEGYVEATILCKGPICALCGVQNYWKYLEADIIDFGCDMTWLVKKAVEEGSYLGAEGGKGRFGFIGNDIVQQETQIGEVSRACLNGTSCGLLVMIIHCDVFRHVGSM